MGAKDARRTGKTVRKRQGLDWGTPLALLLFFPVGISRMWKARCRWPRAVKYAVSGVYVAAALTAAVVMTLSIQPIKGGVELRGAENEMEIYGPELPESFVQGYTKVTGNSGVLNADVNADEDDTIYVYAAEDAKCYHTWKCKFAYASSKRITAYEAYFLGYKPCNLCAPPIYNSVTGATEAQISADADA